MDKVKYRVMKPFPALNSHPVGTELMMTPREAQYLELSGHLDRVTSDEARPAGRRSTRSSATKETEAE